MTLRERIKHKLVYSYRYLTRNVTETYESGMSSVDKVLFYDKLFNTDGHNDLTHKEWRMRRINKALNIYGLDWYRGKRVLVLGDGRGFVGSFFAEIGAKVLSLEGRRGNVNLAKLQHRNVKGFDIKECDLSKDFTHFGRFDLIINWGLIEVMEDADLLIGRCCKMADEILVESIVFDSTDDRASRTDVRPVASKSDCGLTDVGVTPSAARIVRLFDDRMFKVDRYFDSDLNCPGNIYDWKHGDRVANPMWLRRFWRFYL